MMMKKHKILLSTLFGLSFAHSVSAQAIKYVDYNKDGIINIQTAQGIASEIVFGEDEIIEHFSFGFADAWSAEKAKDNVLVFKQTAEDPETNLLVSTNLRNYVFTLTSGNNKWRKNPSSSKATYSTRIRYRGENGGVLGMSDVGDGNYVAPAVVFSTPEQEAKMLKYKNYQYRATSGADRMVPIKMGDDGVFTYLKFPIGASRFAIFQRVDDKDSIINFNQRNDGWVVLHGVYDHLVIRLNDQAVEIRRNHYLRNEAGGHRLIKKTAPKLESTDKTQTNTQGE